MDNNQMKERIVYLESIIGRLIPLLEALDDHLDPEWEVDELTTYNHVRGQMFNLQDAIMQGHGFKTH